MVALGGEVGAPVDMVAMEKSGVPVDVAGVPVDVAGVPVDVAGFPVDVVGVPVDVEAGERLLTIRGAVVGVLVDQVAIERAVVAVVVRGSVGGCSRGVVL